LYFKLRKLGTPTKDGFNWFPSCDFVVESEPEQPLINYIPRIGEVGVDLISVLIHLIIENVGL
jgi:hypothetical protein